MRRFRISTSARWASTSASGTWRRSRSRRAVWVSWKRVSFCQSVSSPSRPTYLIPNTLPKQKATSSRTGTRRQYSTGDADLDRRLTALVEELKLAPVDARSTYELLVTAIRMAGEPLSRLDRKLVNASVKEMRYAFNVFSKYRDRKKVSVFGSARTPADDSNYRLAREFGRRMAAIGWMVVTGAGPGIMSAANEGAGQESSFGVNIVLPVEAEGGGYWRQIDAMLRGDLLTRDYIDSQDLGLYHLTESIDDAVAYIQRFYRVYHSQRYVDGKLILRLNSPLTDEKVTSLNNEFGDILRAPIERVTASSGERQDGDVPDLPRLRLDFDRSHFGRLRQLIDRLNE